MADSQQSSYRSIFKATSLFGGLQAYQILISVIKSKIIAVLLGPAGMGMIGLYQSAVQLIQSLSAMGLSSSAVRDVSEANGTGDKDRINNVVSVLRRLVWFTGSLGMIIVIAFSPILSQTTFGTKDYTIPFVFLSLTLLFDQISAGQRVVLQGLRRLKHLAKASAYGATMTLVVAVPIYYLFGTDGIVPTLVLTSLISLLFTWFYARKIDIVKVKKTIGQTFHEGSKMLKMGWAMSLSSILAYLSAYLFRGYIRMLNGTEAVGLYTAGFTILTAYVGMVFTAIGTDFYPRLAAVNKDTSKSNIVINQQGEIASLIMGPILLVCIFFMPIVIKILYSEEFLGANDFILFAVPGMMFKMGSWLVAYQFIAKADMKLFIINEVVTTLYAFVFKVIGYKYFGLTGVGVAFTFSLFLYMVQVVFFTKRYYKFQFTRAFIKLFVVQCVAVASSLSFKLLNGDNLTSYLVGTFICIVAVVWSLCQLNKKMDLMSFIKQKIKK